jgi:inhibitor of KinA sporulation pathway (predicted exonuclease)
MSRVRLDRLVVFDLEETCWEGEPPDGEFPEIIQIGAVEVLVRGEPRLGRSINLTVRPRRSTVSAFCTSLTGLTANTLRRAQPFPEAVRTLQKAFSMSAQTWAAWGRDDLTLARDFAKEDMEPPAMGGFLNLSALHGMLVGAAKPANLSVALQDYGMTFEGRPHDALYDAVNTARIFMAMSGRVRLLIAHEPIATHPAEPRHP